MSLRLLYIIILMSILSCTSAIYEIQQVYEKPTNKGAKACLLQCNYMKNNCNTRCNSKQHNCIVDNIDPFHILNQDQCYVKKQNCFKTCSSNDLCIRMCEYHWYNCQKKSNKDLDCSNTCSEKCQLNYNNCFIDCGGKIKSQKMCIAFCKSSE